MKYGYPLIILVCIILLAGCNIVPSRSSMYRAAGEEFGHKPEHCSVMIAPYWLTGAEEGWPVEVVNLDNSSTYDANWESHHIIHQREDGRWEIIWD